MATISDIIDGTEISKDGEGYSAKRVFIVTELSGDGAGKIKSALEASGIPALDEPHPAIPDMWCSGLSADAIDSQKAKVTATYTTPKKKDSDEEIDDLAKPSISIGATLQTVTTNLDYQGKLIEVPYTATGSTTASDPARAEIEVQIPLLVFQFTRVESVAPIDKALACVQHINDGPVFAGAKHTWLCSRIEGTSNDGGESYTVNYEFIYNPSTWNVVAVYRDSDGEIPEDIEIPVGVKAENDSGNGWKVVRMYPTANFAPLGLTI